MGLVEPWPDHFFSELARRSQPWWRLLRHYIMWPNHFKCRAAAPEKISVISKNDFFDIHIIEAMNSYKKELELLNITLPVIYFPFNSVSWSSDYSVNQFVLYMKDFNHQYVRDWFDYPGGALQTSGAYHSRSCLLYTSPSPRDKRQSRMPSSA